MGDKSLREAVGHSKRNPKGDSKTDRNELVKQYVIQKIEEATEIPTIDISFFNAHFVPDVDLELQGAPAAVDVYPNHISWEPQAGVSMASTVASVFQCVLCVESIAAQCQLCDSGEVLALYLSI